MIATPTNILTVILLDSVPEPSGLATPTFLIHRNCEIINVYSFKPKKKEEASLDP